VTVRPSFFLALYSLIGNAVAAGFGSKENDTKTIESLK
jgi:hypothetical protein